MKLIEGAYYELDNGYIGRAIGRVLWSGSCGYDVCGNTYAEDGTPHFAEGPSITRRVWVVHTDPAEQLSEKATTGKFSLQGLREASVEAQREIQTWPKWQRDAVRAAYAVATSGYQPIPGPDRVKPPPRKP